MCIQKFRFGERRIFFDVMDRESVRQAVRCPLFIFHSNLLLSPSHFQTHPPFHHVSSFHHGIQLHVMKIVDKIAEKAAENKPFYSFEYFPPKTSQVSGEPTSFFLCRRQRRNTHRKQLRDVHFWTFSLYPYSTNLGDHLPPLPRAPFCSYIWIDGGSVWLPVKPLVPPLQPPSSSLLGSLQPL